MRRIFCVLCIVTVILGWSIGVFADPHGTPGTGDELTSSIIVIMNNSK